MKTKVASAIAAAMAVCCATAANFYIKDGVHDWTKGENYEGNAAPSASNDRVFVRAGRTVYLDSTDTSSLNLVNRSGFIIQPVAWDSRVMVDVADPADNLTLVCRISTSAGGSAAFSETNGVLVKTGSGTLTLDSTGESLLFCTGIEIREGALKAKCANGEKPNFGHVTVSNNAAFYLPPNCGYFFVYGLWGEGLVTTEGDATQFRIGSYNRSYEGQYSWFSGVIDKGVYLFCVAGNLAGVNSVSTNEVHTWGAYEHLSSQSMLGVYKFGMKGEASSSVGSGGTLWTDDLGGGYRYLGPGETTDKVFKMKPVAEGYSTIDGGPHGNLVLKGNLSVSSSNLGSMGRMCLAGTNAEPCRVEGSMSSLSWTKGGVAYTFHLLKTGSGTWHISDTDNNGKNRAWNGGIAVREGTLRFDSLDNAGMACSLGLATNLNDGAYGGAYDPSHDVDYAFALGGDGTQGTLEFAGSGTTTNGVWSENRTAVMNGDGRFKNDQDKPFRFKGVRSLSASAKTLTLDGSSTAENTLADVTDDGAGAISLAKNGSGTWTLTGTNSFRGSLAVNGGRLVVANVATNKFSWFRWTIRHASTGASGAAECYAQEFALYSSAPARQNRRLGVCTNYADIAVGQAALQTRRRYREDQSLEDGLPWHHLGRLFDDCLNYTEESGWPVRPDTSGYYRKGWGLVIMNMDGSNNQAICRDNPNSWVSVLMRLNPETMQEVASYDICRGNTTCPESYFLEGSVDGLHWKELDDVASSGLTAIGSWEWLHDPEKKYTQGDNKRKDHVGKAIAGRDADAVWPMLNNVSAVSVAEGAVLEAVGEVTIPNLRVDASGAGTIRNFSFAPAGNVDVVNLPAGRTTVVLPGTYENCTGFSNVADWTLTVGGKDTTRYTKELVDGRLILHKRGFAVIVR